MTPKGPYLINLLVYFSAVAGFNKRATTFYLMQQHREAIEDCKIVLEMNPFHFGAASGMGMCLAAVGKFQEAIAALEQAVEINPRLEHLKHHIMQLEELIKEQERGRKE